MKYPPQIIRGAILIPFALLFLTQQMFAQLSEDFSDGDFSTNPAWIGTDSFFVVENEMLRLNASANDGSAQLSTPILFGGQGTWQIDVQLDFNPSMSNSARIYILSDQFALDGPLNGYYIQIGNSQDDIRLYRQMGYAMELIVDGRDGFTDRSSNSVTLSVSRTVMGKWEIFANGELLGTTTGSTSVDGKYYGIFCTYTASRSDKFYFDNILYSMEIIPPDFYHTPQWKDIVINEIFPDPSPTVGLPPVEFVELYNRSESEVNLHGWVLQDPTSKLTLKNLRIRAGEYLILTSAQEWFNDSGKAWGDSSFPSLNNSGETLWLIDRTGVTVDSIHYSDTWFDADKREGGWSLELIDPNNVCSGDENWSGSVARRGGTPGTVNSVKASNPDVTGPSVISLFPETDSTLVIVFNEPLDKVVPSAESFRIDPEIPVNKTRFSDGTLKKLILVLDDKIEPHTIYTMNVSNVVDCAGNLISNGAGLIFGKPESIERGDVLINEILFNPKPLGSDFVELVNNSDKFIDLRTLALSNISGQSFENRVAVSTEPVLFLPHDYLLLTEDIDATLGAYPGSPEKQMLQIDELPPFNDDEGSAGIWLGDTSIDQMQYTSEMHNIFLRNDEGVSLERISLARASNDVSNWTSASSLTGFATPGYPNSNKGSPGSQRPNTILADPEVFIPIYGQPDYTLIKYALPNAGYVGSVKIFDSHGRLIKQLASNEILGNDGAWRWEGDTDYGGKVRMGVYLIIFQVFDATGQAETFRGRVAVASRL